LLVLFLKLKDQFHPLNFGMINMFFKYNYPLKNKKIKN